MSLEVPFLLSNSCFNEIFHSVKSAFYFVLIFWLSKGIVTELCVAILAIMFCICKAEKSSFVLFLYWQTLGLVCGLIFGIESATLLPGCH